jgi:hypothetical protein
MKARSTAVLVLTLLLALAFSSVASAGANNPAQRTSAGWLCINAGPNDWVHCFTPGAFSSSPSVQVQVFETTDLSSTEATFHGTEILIRDDLYAGQPCVKEGGEAYEFLPSSETGLPFDYRACHH